jgi:hypothetical protein
MSDEKPTFGIGDRVRLMTRPPYLKTADPMPMLRPPDVVQLGEEGTVIDQRLQDTWGVRFQRGTFLVDGKYLEAATAQPTSSSPPSESRIEPPPNTLEDESASA